MPDTEGQLLGRLGEIHTHLHQAKQAAGKLQSAAGQYHQAAGRRAEQLGNQIRKAGVGTNEEAELAYCHLLMNRHRMAQAHALSGQDRGRFPEIGDRVEKSVKRAAAQLAALLANPGSLSDEELTKLRRIRDQYAGTLENPERLRKAARTNPAQGSLDFDFDEEAHPRQSKGTTDAKYRPGQFVPKARQLKGFDVADHQAAVVDYMAGAQQQTKRGSAAWRAISNLQDKVFTDPYGLDVYLAHSDSPMATGLRQHLGIETEERPGHTYRRMLSQPLTEDDLASIKSNLDYVIEQVEPTARNKYNPEMAKLARENLNRLKAVPYRKWNTPEQAEAWLLKQDPHDPIVEDVLDGVDGDASVRMHELVLPERGSLASPTVASNDPLADWQELGVRSPTFKRWFGDWETDPGHASKVVSPETGEPADTWELRKARLSGGRQAKPVYHGTGRGGYTAFDFEKTNPNGLVGPGFYFTEDELIARQYVSKERPEKVLSRGLVKEDLDRAKEIAAKLRDESLNDTELSQTDASAIKSYAYELDRVASIAHTTGYLETFIKDAGDRPYNQTVCRILGVDIQEVGAPKLYQCYLNIRQPWDGDRRLSKDDLAEIWKNWPEDHYDKKQFADRDPSWITNAHGKSTVKLFSEHFDESGGSMEEHSKTAFIRALQKMGYDGLTHIGGNYAGRGTVNHRVWVAWEPTQIKAGDEEAEGTFDPANPDIRKAARSKKAPAGQGAFNFDEEAHPRAQDTHGKYKPGEFVPKAEAVATHSYGPTPAAKLELTQIRQKLKGLRDRAKANREAGDAVPYPTQELHDSDQVAWQKQYDKWASDTAGFSAESKTIERETAALRERESALLEPNLPPAPVYTGNEAEEYQQQGVQAHAFRQWFGDWVADPEEASKVVTPAGEPAETHNLTPVTVFHGTAYGGFQAFDPNKDTGSNIFGKGFYFTEDRGIAEEYAKKDADDQAAAAARATGLQTAAGEPVTHMPAKTVAQFVADYPHKNQIGGIKAAAEVAREPNGINVEKFLAAFKDPELMVEDHWGKPQKNHTLGVQTHMLPRLFATLKLKPTVPPAHVFECYLNVRKPFDMDEPITQDEIDEFVDYVNGRDDAYGEFSLMVDDLLDRDEWDKLQREMSHLDERGQVSRPTVADLVKIKQAAMGKRKNVQDAFTGKWQPSAYPLHGIFHLSPADQLTKGDFHYIASDGHHYMYERQRFTDWLRERGNDGIHHTGGFNIGTHNHSVWIAFHPGQIKSLANQGTFNPADPNIDKAFPKLLLRLA